MSNHIFIGFWGDKRSNGENIMPWDTMGRRPLPKANSAKTDQTNIINAIKNVQQVARRTSYMGFSCCRICASHNGCEEYAIDNFVWPAGYVHYLEEHNVAVDKDFANYVLNFDPSIPHDTTFEYDY